MFIKKYQDRDNIRQVFVLFKKRPKDLMNLFVYIGRINIIYGAGT
jgi:hypothetical protein